MIKKINLLIIAFFCLVVFIPSTNALEYYENINFSVRFSENVDVTKINNIIVNYTDATGKINDLIICKKNNFKEMLTDVIYGDISFDSFMVENDLYANYIIKQEHTVKDKSINVLLTVSYRDKISTTKKTTIDIFNIATTKKEEDNKPKKTNLKSLKTVFIIAIIVISFILIGALCKVLSSNK